jgi:hypothetical protein
MPDIETLRQKMEAAAQALDFEEARRLRDTITLISGGARTDELENSDVAGLTRQQPGAMGLGTGQPRVAPPAGWTPPPRPDLKTRGQRRRPRRKQR